MAQLLALRLEKLIEQQATNVYEHLSKDDCKEIKARMKDEWHRSEDMRVQLQDLYAPRILCRP